MTKEKVFQDATQGYIAVDEKFANNLIDSIYMQREKSVSQVGLRAIFSGANHDRFSHSLGVYNVGKKLFASFKKNFLDVAKQKKYAKFKNDLNEYEVLFNIVCLLHDIGHPAFSHTLEYIYDSEYINLEFNAPPISLAKYVDHLVERYIELKKTPLLNNETYLKMSYLRALNNKEGTLITEDGLSASQHEMMGALMVLTDTKLQTHIKTVLNKKGSNKPLTDQQLGFIARMITGHKYEIRGDNNTIAHNSLKNCIISLLNGKVDADCIDYLNRNSHFSGYSTNDIDVNRLCSAFSVSLKDGEFRLAINKSALSSLEGLMQARNFEPKWLYTHHKITYFNSVVIKYLMKMSGEYYYDKNFPAIWNYFLESVLNRRLKSILRQATNSNKGEKLIRRLYNQYKNGPTKSFSASGFKKFISALNKNTKYLNLDPGKKLASDLHSFLLFDKNVKYLVYLFIREGLKLKTISQNYRENADSIVEILLLIKNALPKFQKAFTVMMLSPGSQIDLNTTMPNMFPHYTFSNTTDSGIEKLFSDIKGHLPNDNNLDIHKSFRKTLFEELLEEYSTRNFRKSLWKSFEEYKIFIDNARGNLFSFSEANEMFKNLILDAGQPNYFIELENYQKAKKAAHNHLEHVDGFWVNNYDKNPDPKLEDYTRVFSPLGNGMIIVFAKCVFKNYDDLLIKFNRDTSIKYKDIKMVNSPETFQFPYIYYKEGEVLPNNSKRENLLRKLSTEFKKYLVRNCGGIRPMDIEKISFLKGKIIRDPVHGDIFVEERFLKIIETRAFQRLHRIKQLATANYVFPEAVHTRFAHSLGTFHVMQKMLEHFCAIFDQLKLKYSEEQKNVILAAALLHDIGHGPFSHTFESISGNRQTHEEWTKEIINNDDELNKVFRENFGPNFKNAITNCLNHSDNDPYSLNHVFSELISSNLDADRIDYLIRDSQNTGEKAGIFDMQKLISSMILTEYNGKLRVAINENALSTVEQFILARYDMYLSVYYSPYKVLTETLFKKLCEKIIKITDTYAKGCIQEKTIATQIQSTGLYHICNGEINVMEYLKLDDYSIMNDISHSCSLLKSLGNEECEELLNCLLYRGKYQRKHILSDSIQDYERFQNHFNNQDKNISIDDFENGIIVIQKVFNAYSVKKPDKTDEEILIMHSNGEISPFSLVSKFFQREKDVLWKTNFVAMYLNEAFFKEECKQMGKEEMAGKLITLIDSYDLAKLTEIENKYTVSKDEYKAAEVLMNKKILFEKYKRHGGIEKKTQVDIYFDTKEYLLNKNDYSLRCRSVNGKNIFTLKKPGKLGEKKDESQFIRLEFNMESTSEKLTKDVKDFLTTNGLLTDFEGKSTSFSYDELKPVVVIQNKRISCLLRNTEIEDFACEVSLDDVSYKYGKREEKDYQIEIELKSNCIYRVNLNELAMLFCKEIGIDNPNEKKAKSSKYQTAINKLKYVINK